MRPKFLRHVLKQFDFTALTPLNSKTSDRFLLENSVRGDQNVLIPKWSVTYINIWEEHEETMKIVSAVCL